MGGMGKTENAVTDAITTLSGLIRDDLAELRDAVIQVDERTSTESQMLNERMAKLTATFTNIDERLRTLETWCYGVDPQDRDTQRGKGQE